MTTIEIVFRYAAEPAEQTAVALARVREVYGIRGLALDREARTLQLEYDATRLSAATITHLVRVAGLDIVEEVAQMQAPQEAASSA